MLRGLRFGALDIEDILQETYSRILSTSSVENIRYPKQYALATAKAVVISHLRRQRVVPIISCENLDFLDIPDPEVNAEVRLEFQEEVLAVTSALAKLPRKCREVVILRRVEGLSQRDVAGRLRISEKSVERYMAVGAERLVKLFGRGGKTQTHASHGRKKVRTGNGDLKLRD